MIWFIAILVAATGISITIIISYRRQIKSICRQLAFLEQNESNMIAFQYMDSSDIRELIQRINNLIVSQREIRRRDERNNTMLKETITGISHDIRTPLTSLNGYFQLLAECGDKEERERYLKIIQSRITSLKEMLEELFTYVKLKDENYELELSKCGLNKIMYESVFSFYSDFKARGIEPVIRITEEALFIESNEAALKRILQNIIKNSLDHGENDVSITLDRDGDDVKIVFSNAKSDILDVDTEKVFDRFYKADKSRSRTSTGLGLSIAKELVLKTGGWIYAEVKDERFIITAVFRLVSQK